MKEPAFYIEKADEILSNIDYYQKNRYSDSKYSLGQLVLDTELKTEKQNVQKQNS